MAKAPGAGRATAALALPRADALAGRPSDRAASDRHPHLRCTGKTSREYRMRRRANTRTHGDPNARDPERMGYG